MADFAPADAKTRKTEAGYANDPADAGGETWAGISRVHWPDWPGWQIVDAAKAELGVRGVTKQERALLDAKLTPHQGLEVLRVLFYTEEFWDALTLDREPSQALAEKVYDVCVNMGGKPARSAMQAAYARIKAETERLGLGTL